MSTSLYLINPANSFPGYNSVEVYAASGFAPAVLSADLAITTVAALAPSDFSVRLCEEHLTPIDFDSTADFIGITGKFGQWDRMRAIAAEFRKRGKTVIIGGPYASLSPQVVRPHCDILVRGELEEIAADFFSDLRSGRWQTEYIGGRADMALSPMPRWDLYPNEQAVVGSLQTSRGCPFECEFCDVIQYVGRKQRHKAVPQVLRELDELYRYGYRNIFLSDDNFTAYRARTKELLQALREWNDSRQQGAVGFITQLSIDAARDPELLQMCADAGLNSIMIGIETPNEESLKETRKRQNLKIDLHEAVDSFVESGIMVMGGMVIGFDHDGPDIFDMQYRFAMASAIPIFNLVPLFASMATPLHDRMARDGRLDSGTPEAEGFPWYTNIVPILMTREQLLTGMRWLANKLYEPRAFSRRVLRFIDLYGTRRSDHPASPARRTAAKTVVRRVAADGQSLAARFRLLGPEEAEVWSVLSERMARKPETVPLVMAAIVKYMHIRFMYHQWRVWDPALARLDAPDLSAPPATAAAALASPPADWNDLFAGRAEGELASAAATRRIQQLLLDLNRRNVRIFREGDRLNVVAGHGGLDGDLRELLMANKTELLAVLPDTGAPRSS